MSMADMIAWADHLRSKYGISQPVCTGPDEEVEEWITENLDTE